MFARKNSFDAIVSLDEDFFHLLQKHKSPPKIIWLRTGNCITPELAQLLLQKKEVIIEFMASAEKDCLDIFRF